MGTLRTRTNRAINHRGKNSARSLEKHARFPYNDMQMYLTTIPRGVCDPVVAQTNRIRHVLARINVKFRNNCRNDDRPRNSLWTHSVAFNLFIDTRNILSNETTVAFFRGCRIGFGLGRYRRKRQLTSRREVSVGWDSFNHHHPFSSGLPIALVRCTGRKCASIRATPRLLNYSHPRLTLTPTVRPSPSTNRPPIPNAKNFIKWHRRALWKR